MIGEEGVGGRGVNGGQRRHWEVLGGTTTTRKKPKKISLIFLIPRLQGVGRGGGF